MAPLSSPLPSPSPSARYAIRRLKPEDAAGIVECVRSIYGDSYVHPELYRADEILRLNASDELLSVVAVAGEAPVVGHYALERPGLGAIAETGEAMVLPDHRHHLLMEHMRRLLEEEAQRLELHGLFGHAVTNHVFTQRVVEGFGEKACAVSLGWSPRSFHNMPAPLPQRMSEILYFKFLRKRSPVVVHFPGRHREWCHRIYGQFGMEVDDRVSYLPSGRGALKVDHWKALQRGLIRVERAGDDTAAQIRRTRASLAAEGVEAIFLELPLAQAGAPELCRAAEEEGFSFSGIGPCFAPDGDALRLQWLRDPLDISLLEIESEFARELVDYAARERERVARAVAS